MSFARARSHPMSHRYGVSGNRSSSHLLCLSMRYGFVQRSVS
nr:MAG TPA: hypothetical protein [Caudoviricetes sp.]